MKKVFYAILNILMLDLEINRIKKIKLTLVRKFHTLNIKKKAIQGDYQFLQRIGTL